MYKDGKIVDICEGFNITLRNAQKHSKISNQLGWKDITLDVLDFKNFRKKTYS
jgi:hypothetical protein